MRKFFKGQAERVTTTYVEADGYTEQLNWFDADAEHKVREVRAGRIQRLTGRSDSGTFHPGVGTNPDAPLAWITEDEKIVAASRPYALEMTVTAANNAGQIVGGPVLTATDPAVIALADASAQRVVLVNNATRRGIQRTIASGVTAGYSPFEIAYGSTATRKAGFRPLSDMVQHLYRGRPECIARTEMAYSNNGASLWRYRERGQSLVEVLDGPGCALTHHVQGLKPGESSAQDINGETISIQEANEWQLAHPNCRRVFVPLEQTGGRPPRRGRPAPISDYGVQALTTQQRAQIAADTARTTRVAPKPPKPPAVRPENPFERPDLRDLKTADDYMAYGRELEAHIATLAAEEELRLLPLVAEAIKQEKAAANTAYASRIQLRRLEHDMQYPRQRLRAARATQTQSDRERYYQIYGTMPDADEIALQASRVRSAQAEIDKAAKVFAQHMEDVAQAGVRRDALEVELLAIKPVLRLEQLRTSRAMGPPKTAAGKPQYAKISKSITKANRRAIQDAQDRLPTAWLNTAEMRHPQGLRVRTSTNKGGKPRGKYSPKYDGDGKQTDEIFLHNDKRGASANDSVALHEYIHRIEHADMDLGKLMQQFYYDNTEPGLPYTIDFTEYYRYKKGSKLWPHDYMGRQYGNAADIPVGQSAIDSMRQAMPWAEDPDFGRVGYSGEILTMLVEAALALPVAADGHKTPWEKRKVQREINDDKDLMGLVMGLLAGF